MIRAIKAPRTIHCCTPANWRNVGSCNIHVFITVYLVYIRTILRSALLYVLLPGFTALGCQTRTHAFVLTHGARLYIRVGQLNAVLKEHCISYIPLIIGRIRTIIGLRHHPPHCTAACWLLHTPCAPELPNVCLTRWFGSTSFEKCLRHPDLVQIVCGLVITPPQNSGGNRIATELARKTAAQRCPRPLPLSSSPSSLSLSDTASRLLAHPVA